MVLPIKELRGKMEQLMRENGIFTLKTDDAQHDLQDTTNKDKQNLPFFSGYQYGRLYGWDQYFDAILQIYVGWDTKYIRNSLILFLDEMEHTGFIPRTLPRVWWGEFHAQPFLAQQALLLLKSGDKMEWFFPKYFYKLKAYLLYWLKQLDIRGAGLSVWDHAGHSGMDNHYERAGYFYDAYCEGVDLNSYLVRECYSVANLAKYFGHRKEAEFFETLAERKKEAINKWCWNEQEGIYYDCNAQTGSQIRVKYVGTFATLWANVADKKQAQRLVKEHLLNPNEFARPFPIPALAASEPGYCEGHLEGEDTSCCSWRAHTWMPTNYYVFQGLRSYGFEKEASYIARQSMKMFCDNPFREYYSAETGKGYGLDPFWGWSGLALFMENEFS